MLMLITLLLVAVFAIYRYYSHKYSFWQKRGVSGPKPTLFVGNLLDKLRRGRDVVNLEYARKYGKVYGIYIGSEPQLTIMDSELLKQVFIKDFPNFINRQKINIYHEMFNQNLLFSESANWKRIRSIASPSFTSRKLRGMTPLMNTCVDKLVDYLNAVIQKQDGIIDVKKVLSGFTIDVIASAAFATETNANDDRTKENAVVVNGYKMFDIPFWKALAVFTLPASVLSFLNIRTLANEQAFQFFVNLVSEIVRQRRQQNVHRVDLVQLMMDASIDESELKDVDFNKLTAASDDDYELKDTQNNTSHNSKKSLTEQEIIANCLFFFFAGFETTSSTISHCLYEMAKHPNTQQRLYEDLKKVVDGRDGDDFYDAILHHVPYLEAVIHETLRLYPPVVELNRRADSDSVMVGNIQLEKDMVVVIPAYAIHHSPDYYPNPEQFDPTRFLPENKHLLTPYTFMPFGLGPRNCMGMRFAIIEVKLCVARLVLKYHFRVTPKTPQKLTFFKLPPVLRSKHFEIQVCERK